MSTARRMHAAIMRTSAMWHPSFSRSSVLPSPSPSPSRCCAGTASAAGRRGERVGRVRREERSFSVDDGSGSKVERLSKVLQAAGVSSRRGADDMISQGRVGVTVDGTKIPAAEVHSFTRIDVGNDIVSVDGEVIDIVRSYERLEQNRVYVALYKPKGYVCSTNSNTHKVRSAARVCPVPRMFGNSPANHHLADSQYLHALKSFSALLPQMSTRSE